MLDGFSELLLRGAPQDRAIHLTWQVGTTLPPTSTWQIAYDGLPGEKEMENENAKIFQIDSSVGPADNVERSGGRFGVT